MSFRKALYFLFVALCLCGCQPSEMMQLKMSTWECESHSESMKRLSAVGTESTDFLYGMIKAECKKYPTSFAINAIAGHKLLDAGEYDSATEYLMKACSLYEHGEFIERTFLVYPEKTYQDLYWNSLLAIAENGGKLKGERQKEAMYFSFPKLYKNKELAKWVIEKGYITREEIEKSVK